MKKLLLFITMLLSACGGGGEGGGVAVNSAGGVGSLSVNIQSVDTAVRTDIVAAALAAPLSTYVRVVVSNPNLKYNYQAFKQIRDIPVGSSSTFDAVPASNGYSVEAVSYVQEGGLNRLLKYAKNTVNITANVTNSVTLSMTPIQVTLNVPSPLTGVIAGAPYTVSTIFTSQPTPLQATWALGVQTSDFVAPIHQHLFSCPSIQPHCTNSVHVRDVIFSR